MPGQVINGLVRDRSGAPLAEASIGFASAPVALPDVAALTGTDGRFRLSVPTPGSYSLVCTLPDGTNETRTIEITANADAAVTFDINVDPA